MRYFPSSAWSYPPAVSTSDAGERATPELRALVPRDNRKVYDMRRVIDAVVDGADWFEIQPRFGRAIVCGLARLGGEPAAFVANQPRVIAGSIWFVAGPATVRTIAAPLLFLFAVFKGRNPEAGSNA